MLIDFQAGKNKRMQKKLIVFCSKHPVGEKKLTWNIDGNFWTPSFSNISGEGAN